MVFDHYVPSDRVPGNLGQSNNRECAAYKERRRFLSPVTPQSNSVNSLKHNSLWHEEKVLEALSLVDS